MRSPGTARRAAKPFELGSWSSSTIPSAERPAVGIMGGTYDPIHNGHLEAAKELRDIADLDQVWLMPNAQPPHRSRPVAGAEDRMRMVELAVDRLPGLVPSRLEIERGGISYTIDTIRELMDRFPGQRFEMLLGSDAAAHIAGWHRAADVLAEANFVIFNRPGTSLTQAELARLGFAPERSRVVHLETPAIAAHEIRDRLAGGGPVDDLIPPGVAAYIREHRLYGT
ncbi:MAG TPA: nicotinate-nucleotide adenylyltransferase [Candidatus Dormibacteraeota bacterium]|nr:nicotinate-nucleotide adenylyltransferase [Candidatus Dormibacteraeota bacterium]